MNKKEFLREVSERTALPPGEVQKVLEAMANVAGAELRTAGRIRVPGLATLTAKEYGARPGRNPRTGEEYQIAATVRVRAKAATTLAAQFAGGAVAE